MKKTLTVSSNYPRYNGDTMGGFIHELSKRLGDKNGLEMFALVPHCNKAAISEKLGSVNIYRFRYFYPYYFEKIAYGSGVSYNLKNSYIAKIQLVPFCISELLSSILLIKKEHIQIIHTHWLLPSGLVGAICKEVFNIPHIVTVHGSDINTINKSAILRKLCRFIIHRSDMIITNSKFTKNAVLSIDHNIDRNNVRVIPIGVNISDSCYDHRCGGCVNLREKYDAEFIILSIGRLIKWKGLDYLISSMPRVLEAIPTAKLIIGGDGPERSNLERLTNELNLNLNVVFTGHINNHDLQEYYRSADVFVLPSINLDGQVEGLGVVLLEAMAAGVPVIGSNVGGIPDIINDGLNGLLVNEKSPDDLSDKIVMILSNNSLSETLIQNGLNTVNSRFSWSRVVDEYCKVYGQLISKSVIRND